MDTHIMVKLPDTCIGKNETRMLFVLDGKSINPRIRIEQGMIYGDGLFREYYHLEYMLPDSFMDLCAEYVKNRGE